MVDSNLNDSRSRNNATICLQIQPRQKKNFYESTHSTLREVGDSPYTNMRKIDLSMGNVADSMESSFKCEYLNEYEAKNEMSVDFKFYKVWGAFSFLINVKFISLSCLFKKRCQDI